MSRQVSRGGVLHTQDLHPPVLPPALGSLTMSPRLKLWSPCWHFGSSAAQCRREHWGMQVLCVQHST